MPSYPLIHLVGVQKWWIQGGCWALALEAVMVKRQERRGRDEFGIWVGKSVESGVDFIHGSLPG
jgi:hypothetical protein